MWLIRASFGTMLFIEVYHVELTNSVGILKCYYWDATLFRPVAGRRKME